MHNTKITERLEPTVIERNIIVKYLRTINSQPQVAMYLIIIIGMIFTGYNYFITHGTDAQALIAALVVGSFIWAAFGKEVHG